MLNKIITLAIVATLTALLMPSRVGAWGAAHVGYTHVGPAGVYHTGRTAAAGPGGVYAGGHTSAYGAYGGAYRAGYGARQDTAGRTGDTATAEPMGDTATVPATPVPQAIDTSASCSVRGAFVRQQRNRSDRAGSYPRPGPSFLWR